MKTLRDESRRMTDAMWQHIYTNQFFSKYGSYRVVEGELVWAGVYRGEQMERLRDRVCVEVPDKSGSHYVHIGRIGETVKFILAPELCAHRVTPEEYEKALDTITAYVQQRRESDADD